MKTPSTSRLARPASLAGFALLALVTFGLAAPSPARVPGGLQGRWKLDEGTGTSAADSSGTGNTGTLAGGVSWTTGRSGNALSFDGSSGYVTAGTTGMPANNAAQTVSWWMNLASVPSGVACAIDLHNDASASAIQTGFRSGRLTVWKHGGGVLVDANAPSTGAWHHVAYTYDGTTHKLFLDGAQVSSSTVAPQTAAVTSLTFGRWNGGAQEYFAGKLDEIRIYSRTLTATEIQGLAHDPTLEALVKFDEGTGTTASDSSGMGHDGTLDNGATWATGQSGNALSLDGTDDNVSLSLETGLPANNGSQTVAYWMNVASNPSGTQCAVDLHNDSSASALQIGFRNGNVTAWNHGGNVLAQATPPSAGSWHHVAYTFDGTTHTIYIDGVSAGTSTASPQTAAVTSFVLGRWNGGPGEYFGGNLDELRIYSRTLSATEIAGLAGGTGTGLSAVYYDNMDFTGTFVQQTDSTVNFNWGTGIPTTGIGADTFSVLWTGQVQAQYSEVYTFYTNTDDGVKLWVNDRLLVDNPVDQAVTEKSGSLLLSGGMKYNLRMEYFENGGLAQAELRWSSASTPKAIIRQSQLYPSDTVTPTLLNATSNTADLTKVYLRFNARMHKATAETTTNYTLSGGLTVTSVVISADKLVVTLTASGSVTLGTTAVTATNLKNLEQETMAQTTKTIVSGDSQGIPDSSAITLSLPTDSNRSVVMINTAGGLFGLSTPAGGYILTVTAPGTSATTVELVQQKEQGGTSAVTFESQGSSAVVTTSGGSPNQATILVKGITAGSTEKDFTIRARVSGEERGIKPATVTSISIDPKCVYMPFQHPGVQTLTQTPAFAGVQYNTESFLVDRFGAAPALVAKPTMRLALAQFPATGSDGKAMRNANPCGTQSYCYARVFADGSTASDSCGDEDYTEPPCKGGKDRGEYMAGGSCFSNSTPYNHGGSPDNSCIDTGDAEKKIDQTDLRIRGRGMDYVFRRVYRSHNYRRAIDRKDFGENWIYSYADDYLLKDGSGADSSANYLRFFDFAVGSAFVNDGVGKWRAAEQDFQQLRINSIGDFEIRDQRGEVHVYNNFSTGTSPNKNGRLREIRDRNKNRMTFHYEQIDPNDTVSGDEKYVLAYVIDTLGREIRYQYFARTAQTVGGRPITSVTSTTSAFGRLALVKDFKGNMQFDGTDEPDFAGQDANRQIQFGYDSEGNLAKVRSPISLGTPNGNNFPDGRTRRFKYILESDLSTLVFNWGTLTNGQKDVVRSLLLHKMSHIWYPNEVKGMPDTEPPVAEAAEVLTYNTTATFSPASSTFLVQGTFLGFVTSYMIGGTNGNTVPSGGTIAYSYSDLNPSRLFPPPHFLFDIPTLKVNVTDRNGNQAEYTYNGDKTCKEYKEFPRGFRAGEPTSYTESKIHQYDRLASKITYPEGNSKEYTFNSNATDRFQNGNLVRSIRRPDATRGGDQLKIETVYVYEPIYNRPWLTVLARGADMNGSGFTPPISDPATRTISDPYDITKTLNLRYAVVNYYDYQESVLASTAWPATSTWTPTSVDSITVKATEVLLVRELSLPDGNDTERADSIRTLRTRLSVNLVKLGLGDLNGDGIADPVASGNPIRTAYGSPVLLANTNQHKVEGDIEIAGDLIDETKNVVDGGTQEGFQGARLQTIVWMYQYNAFGQLIKMLSPEGNVKTFAYFPENNADGDAILTPTPADGRILDAVTGGYLMATTRDTTRSYFQQTTGTPLTGVFSNSNTNPAITDIKNAFSYDDVGNVTTTTNGRGIREDYFVNELDEVVQITLAADVSGAASASPSDPLYNHSDTQQKLTAFAYKTRTFRDYNGNVVLSQVEDRGNTSSVDGSGLGTLPSQATGTTPGLSSADPSGGEAYVDSLSLYDRLNDLIELRHEVDSTRSLNARYRFDGNQHQVLMIYPEGNADSLVFDERELFFQLVRGASARPSAGKYASGDPTSFTRPGGASSDSSMVTYNYDKNQNVSEIVDAISHGGTSSSLSGSGDVMKLTYDGYDRPKGATDALGNKSTFSYDPDSNLVRAIRDGDPIDDVAGGTENKTLSVTETIYDELGRTYVTHRVLFQTPDASPTRTPTLTDTPAMDSLAAYLADASSDTASVPGSTGITVIGRMTSIKEYDREGRITFRIQDDLDTERTAHDGVSRVIETEDSARSNGFSGGAYTPGSIDGNLVCVAYDDDSNIIEVRETDVTTIVNVQNEDFRTTYLFDSLDRLQTAFDNRAQASDMRYNSRGNEVARADAVSPTADETGRSFSRRGCGSTAVVAINKYGNATRSRYDGRGRLSESEVILTSSGKGDGTNIGATLDGILSTAPSPDSSQSGDGLISAYHAYDDNSQLLAVRDDDGSVTAYIYDNLNRQRVERKGLGVTGTSFTLTGGDSGAFSVSLRGGVTPVDTESSGTDITRTYDQDSNVTTLGDEAGNSFSCSYDALNRKKFCSITVASGYIGTRGTNAQTWKFDGLSRLGECFDANEPTPTLDDVICQYFYDSLSRKVEETQKIGSLSAKAVSCSFELDCGCGAPAVALPSMCTYPDGRKVDNEYDRLDRLLSRHDVEGTTEHSAIGIYQYIGKGRVAVLTYQNNIRLTHIGQVSGQNVDTGFDSLRRTVNHRWESFTTQALGTGTLVMGFEYQDGNATPASMFDRADNKRLEYKTHDPSNSEQYKYDSAYRLTSMGSGSQGQDARGFERGTFTNTNRTSMAGGVVFSQDWDLEGLGNWTRQDDNARIETRTHSDYNEIVDRVVAGNTATLTHDKNGNSTDTGYASLGGQNFPGGGLRLEWDALNRLRAVWKNNNTPGSTGDDVLVAEYTYDCQHRRMRKVVTNSGSLNGTTSFYYEGWRVIEERDGADAVTNQYTYGSYLDEVWTLDNRRAGAPVAWLNDNTGVYRHFYVSNTVHHVYGLTNEGSSTMPGTLKEAYQYDPYGRQTAITDGNDADTIVNFNANDTRTVGGASTINGSPYMYTGQRLDAETGSMYFKNRYQSPDLGRFLSRDPSGSNHHQSRYSFDGIDPLGLFPQEAPKTQDPKPPENPDRPIDPAQPMKDYNCSGLGFRSYQNHTSAETNKILKDACGEPVKCDKKCKCGEVKCWLWTYLMWFEDLKGEKLGTKDSPTGEPVRVFHMVCGLVPGADATKDGEDPTNVCSKNGALPIEPKTGTGPSFKPPAEVAEELNTTAGKIKAKRKRSDYTEECYCCDQSKFPKPKPK